MNNGSRWLVFATLCNESGFSIFLLVPSPLIVVRNLPVRIIVSSNRHFMEITFKLFCFSKSFSIFILGTQNFYQVGMLEVLAMNGVFEKQGCFSDYRNNLAEKVLLRKKWNFVFLDHRAIVLWSLVLLCNWQSEVLLCSFYSSYALTVLLQYFLIAISSRKIFISKCQFYPFSATKEFMSICSNFRSSICFFCFEGFVLRMGKHEIIW